MGDGPTYQRRRRRQDVASLHAKRSSRTYRSGSSANAIDWILKNDRLLGKTHVKKTKIKKRKSKESDDEVQLVRGSASSRKRIRKRSLSALVSEIIIELARDIVAPSSLSSCHPCVLPQKAVK